MLHFLRAMEENNLELHIATLEQMTSIFFAFDHPNYARYTAVYQLMLMNIEESHPGARQLLSSNGFRASSVRGNIRALLNTGRSRYQDHSPLSSYCNGYLKQLNHDSKIT